MDNYDVKKERPGLYSAGRRKFEVIDVPRMRFLMADGHGNPNTSPEYAEVVTALYTTSYAVRAVAKQELGRIHTVGPLEGLWSSKDLEVFRTREKDAWDWTLMIVQPDWITPRIVDAALERVHRTKDLSAVKLVRFEEFTEGPSVQVLHVGPYDEEGPTIARMHDEFVPAQGLTLRGRHHEIYLSDARRAHPSRLRTILRQPVAPAGATAAQ
ncbi:GyrI-like domain-containing protein [Kitasatospora sp. NPDC059827]|uniref:GyrI-like domain-containing protein n=1 Tax=Kitasatospora sp. NPDC059827 TaxID=3346964 RepID=UPI0036606354